MRINKYELNDTVFQYLIDDNNHVFMQMIPKVVENMAKSPWKQENDKVDPRARYSHKWEMGSLVHLYTSENDLDMPGNSMKFSCEMFFVNQYKNEDENRISIVTELTDNKLHNVIHTVSLYKGQKAVEIETEFINLNEEVVELEMLTSFSLDNLSPFQEDDAPNKYSLHRFRAGWSLEGKHIEDTIEDLSLEKSWSGSNGSNEKFGSLGSYPVSKFFPLAVFEDKEYNVFWAAQIVHNASWQMELTRTFDTLSFSGGLGDNDFCGWKKVIKKGESFKAPKAYVAAVCGDLEDACKAITDMHRIAYNNNGEKELYISFNEYCTTWGRPTQEKMLKFCEALKEFDVKYTVIDAGWCKEGCEQDGNGEWGIDKNIFPDPKLMNEKIRSIGMIPGIWFEFEVTTEGSRMFEKDYDYMHLTRNGRVIKSKGIRSYWDFRREDVREYLREKVINFLKKYDFGYIKVDYNANIGKGVDGAESGAEALREHLVAVREFFIEMKKEIPDLVIENCAAGGNRLEPSMLGVATLASFSDAHEAVEIPYIAANLHYLILPAQSLIWAVLHSDDTKERLIYSLAATFLGRMCLSGEVDKLSSEQRKILADSVSFYKKSENVIKNGKTKIYGNRGRNTRYPEGTQIVVRSTDDEILVVCHAYDNPGKSFILDIPNGFKVSDEFYNYNAKLIDNKLYIDELKPFTSFALLLKNK